jgi:hypothetical protein
MAGGNKKASRHFFVKKWRTKTPVYALAGYAVTSKASFHCFLQLAAERQSQKFFTQKAQPFLPCHGVI